MHNYHAQYNVFPFQFTYVGPYDLNKLVTPDCNDGTWALHRLSNLVRLSPFLERPEVFAALNVTMELCYNREYPPHPANRTALCVRIATLFCPSDGLPLPSEAYPTSYRGNVGVGPALHPTSESPDSGNGFFPVDLHFNSALVSDGLTHTVAFSERLIGSGTKAGTAERDFGNISAVPRGGFQTADHALNVCRLAAASPSFPTVATGGYAWYEGSRINAYYTHAQEPNGPIPDAIGLISRPAVGVVTARSNHPGGVNALMGDGSIRFVSESISRTVWRALGTRDGREIVE